MNLAVVLVLVAATAVQEQAAAELPISAFEGDADPTARGRIDELVEAGLTNWSSTG
ncbi:MAG: hypothetical protein MUE50_27395 [Pirellulaceae bacterium]|nr:hypothetical protein [Pirellulaceae bacterium]